jgi:hypothetical protein
MNKLYRRVSTTKPSTFILSIIAIAIAIFLFGGGLYDLAMKPYPVYYSETTGYLFLYPQISEQFISDSMVATILYSLGVVGLLVMYQSTKYAYKPRQAYMMLMVGAVLLLLAYIFLEAAIQQKMG